MKREAEGPYRHRDLERLWVVWQSIVSQAYLLWLFVSKAGRDCSLSHNGFVTMTFRAVYSMSEMVQ
jgi:hypothetical protein